MVVWIKAQYLRTTTCCDGRHLSYLQSSILRSSEQLAGVSATFFFVRGWRQQHAAQFNDARLKNAENGRNEVLSARSTKVPRNCFLSAKQYARLVVEVDGYFTILMPKSTMMMHGPCCLMCSNEIIISVLFIVLNISFKRLVRKHPTY